MLVAPGKFRSLFLAAGFFAGASCCCGVNAATSDDAAMPVRKASSSKSEKPTSTKPETPAKKSEPAKKTTAASSKTSAKSKASTAKEESASTKKKTTVTASSRKKSTETEKTSASSKKSSHKNDEDSDAIALPVRIKSGEKADVSSDEDASSSKDKVSTANAGPVDLPEPQVSGPAAAAQPAQAPYVAPNARTGQSNTGGFFRRLFGRRSSDSQSQASQQPFAFNSDYATRAANAILPAVLPGFGYGGVDLPIGDEDPYRLSTLPTDFRPTDLVMIPKEYSQYGNAIYLRSEAANSLVRMFNDAAAQGLTIRIFSGYRDYQHQQRLYAQAVSHSRNQNSVAAPGRSEHQLGTTADVTNSEKFVTKRSFATTPEGQWLGANAARYGWKMTVLAGNGPRSHADEPWHIRYLGNNVNRSTQTAQQGQPQQQKPSFFSRLGRLFGGRG